MRISRRLRAVAAGVVLLVTGLGGTPSAAAAPRPRPFLRAAPLALEVPALAAPLLSLVAAHPRVVAHYRGTGRLEFALLEGPPGMTIDAGAGILSWTPPAAAEGTEVAVRVRATDGAATAEAAFTLPVASPTPIAASLASTTLTVTAGGTLQGVAFTFPAQLSRPAAELAVATLPPGQAPAIPEGVRRASDFFRVTPVAATAEDAAITLALPSRLVPAGAQPQDLRLYVFTEHATTADEPFWVCAWSDLDVLPGGTVTMTVGELGDLSFVGLEPPGDEGLPPLVRGLGARTLQLGALSVTVSCAGKLLSSGVQDLRQQRCTVTGDQAMTVTVKYFWRRQWQPSATIEELVGWLAAARQTYTAWGMTASPVLEVAVETMTKPEWAGFVDGTQNYRVLHLDRSARSRDSMQLTAAHEYFHHAQSRTSVAGRANLVRTYTPELKWLVEGTASWAQAKVFPSLDSTRLFFGVWEPLFGFLDWGLDRAPVANQNATDPYVRAFFWKMVASRCSGFAVPALVNANLSGDPTALREVAAELASPSWQCDFGAGFGGANRASLAAAMLYYLHATQKMDDNTRLDPAEKAFSFARPATRIAPQRCERLASCPIYRLVLGSTTAAALEVEPVSGVGGDEEVVLEINNSALPASVWVGDDASRQELDQGVAYLAPGTHRYVYGQGGSAPGLFVGLVDPSFDSRSLVELRAGISKRGVFDVTTTFADPLNVVRGCVSWTASASGKVTAPPGVKVEARANELNPGQVLLEVTGDAIAPPFHLTVEGTFDAFPDHASGACTNSLGSSIRWDYSNRRVEHENDDGELVTGSAFAWALDGDSSKPFSRYRRVDVWYDLKVTFLNPDGSVNREVTLANRELALLSVSVELNQP